MRLSFAQPVPRVSTLSQQLPFVIRIRLFGAVLLHRDDGPVTGRAAQRHPLALLALLAASADGAATRDRLVAYLWPESETRRARHLLSQALYVLRRSLGEDCLTTTADLVLLNSDTVWADVVAFRQAVSAGRYEDAADLYAGPFLDGFFLGQSPEFEEWAESERSRIRAEYEDALQRLATAAEEAGDAAKAAGWWRRLARQAPHSSVATLGYMRAVSQAGDRAAAIAQARAHSDTLRAGFDAPPDPEVVALANELARQGDAEPSLLPATTNRGTSSASVAGRRKRSLALGLLALGALLGLGAAGSADRRPEDAARSPKVVVRPFLEGDAASGAGGIGARLAAEIRTTLAYAPEVVLAAEAVPETAPLRAEVWQGAFRRHAGLIVTGRVRRTSGRLTAVALLRSAAGRPMWSHRFDWPADDPDAAVSGLALAIADSLRMRVAPFRPKRYTASSKAYDRFLQGVYVNRRMTSEDLWKALQFYREAYEEDPRFALAHAIAAEAYMQFGGAEAGRQERSIKARQEALRALELDSTLAEGHAALAGIQIWHDGDLEAGERSLRRALMIYPTLPQARSRYGWYLLSADGPIEAGLANVRRALEVDPLNAARSYSLEYALYLARQYEEVAAQQRVTRSLAPDRHFIYSGSPLAEAYRETGRFDEALAEYARLEEATGSSMAVGRAVVYARMGDAAHARPLLDSVRHHEGDASKETARSLARIFSALGDRDAAFHWIERGYEGLAGVLSLRRDPVFDPLRPDPRYHAALRRLEASSRWPVPDSATAGADSADPVATAVR